MVAGTQFFWHKPQCWLNAMHVVNFFSEQNCVNAAGSRNVYDNTCAETGGFQSFYIENSGGADQDLTTWSRNACAGPQTNCVKATDQGHCFNAYDGGGSNAISSGASCGLV